MKTPFLCLSPYLLGLIATATSLQAAEPTPASPPQDREAAVQIAILLDTSNSMDGLIEQAKSQLWKIINEFNEATQQGQTPVVQVALYEYGNTRLSLGRHYLRQVLPFTRDLDKVSEQLFQLTTQGGDEYCGAVIREALEQLTWDRDDKTYKAIFIAGNEPFTQGPVSAQEACQSARRQGVIVNTIHCGSREEGESSGWRSGAALADGRYLTINQDKAITHVEAPQDREITRLSIELNSTYVSYGTDGTRGAANQAAQDSNASLFRKAGSEVQRALTKASGHYENSSWDLVDAVKKSGMKLEAIAESELPAQLKPMPAAERAAFIEHKAAERARIQAEIQKLNEERRQFLARQASAPGSEATFDHAMAQAIREQAARKDIQFRP